MATYEFKCNKCGKRFTTEQSFRDFDQQKKVKCPKCGSTSAARMLSAIHVQTSKKS